MLHPCMLPKIQCIIGGTSQPRQLGSSLQGSSEAHEHRLLHVPRARALRRRTPGKGFLKYET